MLEWLEKWYESQCNGDWEHMFGINIKSLDNPGWNISIDLEDTLEDLEANFSSREWVIIGDFDNRWIGFEVANNKFKGSCDPFNLSALISVFKKIVERVEIDLTEVELSLKK